MLDEKQLLAKAKQGDEGAFSALLEPYQKKIYNLAVRMLRNEQDAQDAGQEALLKMFRSLRTFKEEAAFSTWVYSITKNTCLDILRKLKRKKEDDIENVSYMFQAKASEMPEHMALQKESMGRLALLIQNLPVAQKEVVVLREIDGYSYEEIAELLQISLGTVKSRLARAREALRLQYRKATTENGL